MPKARTATVARNTSETQIKLTFTIDGQGKSSIDTGLPFLNHMLASLANPFVAILLALGFVSILWHMRLGLQVVIEDYVHGHRAKLAALLLNSFFVFLLGAAALYAILKMSFGL